MAVPVLIITSTKGFGELIQQSLQEAGGYIPALAVTGPDAVDLQESSSPSICILDVDLADAPTDKFVESLRDANPEIKLIIIPSEKGKDDDILAALEADAYLAKPFYLPDLLENIERIIQQGGVASVEQVPEAKSASVSHKSRGAKKAEIVPAPKWLQDKTLANQHLTELSKGSASQAALITRSAEIWAYAGELSQPVAKELASSIATYWDDEGSDLARFVHLEETGGEHMMYATGLGGEFVLALVFDEATPFSIIRAQAVKLAKSLAFPPGAKELEPPAQDAETVAVAATPAFEEPATIPADEYLDDEEFVENPFAVPDELVKEFEKSQGTEEEIEEEPLLNAAPLLDDVPPSVPEDWAPTANVTPETEVIQFDTVKEQQEMAPYSPEPAADFIEDAGEYLGRAPAHSFENTYTPDYLADTVASQPVTNQPLVEGMYSSEKLATNPITLGEQLEVESVSPALYNLTYACVLIPRFPDHHLTGTLGTHLSDWVTQVCVAFGWRLEQISIRPDYLQWIVNLPPTASPGHLMRIVRQHTSRRMFLQFPRYEEENPSGEFWAPGYFILSSSQPPPANLINDFIQQTRQRQGISAKL